MEKPKFVDGGMITLIDDLHQRYMVVEIYANKQEYRLFDITNNEGFRVSFAYAHEYYAQEPLRLDNIGCDMRTRFKASHELTPLDTEVEMDPLIAPLVALLREYDFDTFTSCQGGEGHAFQEPTIRLMFNAPGWQLRTARPRLHKLLWTHGYGCYWISDYYDYQSGYRFLELRFYGQDALEPAKAPCNRSQLKIHDE